MKTLKIDYNDDGKKLITYLSSAFPNLSINAIYKSLRKKDIKINGKRINTNEVLKYGDVIELYITDDLLEVNKKNIDIPIVYEDNNIVIFNKPSSLEVVGENSLTSIMEKSIKLLFLEH